MKTGSRLVAICLVGVLVALPAHGAELCAEPGRCEEGRVQSVVIERAIPVLATVDYRALFQLSALAGGKLKEHFFKKNQSYKKNELLLQLENEDLQVQLLRHRTQLVDADYAVQKARISLNHNQIAKIELDKALESKNIARAQYDLQLATQKNLTLRAPFTCRVLRVSPKLSKASERNVTVVQDGEFLAEVVQDERLVFKGTITLPSAFHDFDACRIIVDEGGKTDQFPLISLNPLDTAGTVYEFMFDLPETMQAQNPLGSVMPVRFLQPSRTVARAVPHRFILSEMNVRYCLALREGKAVRVDVMLGEYDQQFIEIFGELDAGETVLAPRSDGAAP